MVYAGAQHVVSMWIAVDIPGAVALASKIPRLTVLAVRRIGLSPYGERPVKQGWSDRNSEIFRGFSGGI
tara:strand:+ start:461 stop:667 length:207 start_codon:yes stop_codon:yes gene_type:complete